MYFYAFGSKFKRLLINELLNLIDLMILLPNINS